MQSSSRIITTNKPTSSFLTGWMPFLSPNQQCQSTEGKSQYYTSVNLCFLPRHQRCSFGRMSNLLETERWLLSVVISQMICMYFTQTIVTVVSSNIFWWHNIQNSLTLQCVLNAAARVHIHRERTVPLQSTVIMKNNRKDRKKTETHLFNSQANLGELAPETCNSYQAHSTAITVVVASIHSLSSPQHCYHRCGRSKFTIKPTAPLSPLWSLQFTLVLSLHLLTQFYVQIIPIFDHNKEKLETGKNEPLLNEKLKN